MKSFQVVGWGEVVLFLKTQELTSFDILFWGYVKNAINGHGM
jgi:hypothetical protein